MTRIRRRSAYAVPLSAILTAAVALHPAGIAAAAADPVVSLRLSRADGTACQPQDTVLTHTQDGSASAATFSKFVLEGDQGPRALDCTLSGAMQVPAGWRAQFVVVMSSFGYAERASRLQMTTTIGDAEPTVEMKEFPPAHATVYQMLVEQKVALKCGQVLPFKMRIAGSGVAPRGSQAVDGADVGTSLNSVEYTRC
ncbi:hypothetical protein GCM10010124_11330 [Pilimelia terevasa]|uniref:Secreted protein n=1 Tax=Pilimelia terevasa TaxID=53372 RepID=A0A8J3BK85_9ACTN|nr:hypothetical protein [Pilimelia terevasa]GGK20436.1 hypothetical protein GCM10010124_11330 [Pilimelia terevasa]